MFGIFLAATIQLDTLSVPGPRGVVTDYEVQSTSTAPVYDTYTPPAAPAATSAPAISSSSSSSTTTGTSQINAPVSVPSTVLSPEVLLNELQTSEPQRTLVDIVREVLPPSTVSTVGAFDRVIAGTVSQVTPIQNDTRSAADSVPLYASLARNCAQGILFAHSLQVGDTGEDVRLAQRFLNTSPETQLAAEGAGSPGNETDIFASKTLDAVKKFQTLYASDILTPLGLSAPTGQWGARTRAKANVLVCGT